MTAEIEPQFKVNMSLRKRSNQAVILSLITIPGDGKLETFLSSCSEVIRGEMVGSRINHNLWLTMTAILRSSSAVRKGYKSDALRSYRFLINFLEKRGGKFQLKVCV